MCIAEELSWCSATLKLLVIEHSGLINPSEGRVKQDTDSALCNTAQRERSAGGGERESESPVKSVRFAWFELSLALSLTRSGHVRPPRHVPLQKASERESQHTREEGKGGVGGGKRANEVAGKQGGERERERGKSEDYRANKHWGKKREEGLEDGVWFRERMLKQVSVILLFYNKCTHVRVWKHELVLSHRSHNYTTKYKQHCEMSNRDNILIFQLLCCKWISSNVAATGVDRKGHERKC